MEFASGEICGRALAYLQSHKVKWQYWYHSGFSRATRLNRRGFIGQILDMCSSVNALVISCEIACKRLGVGGAASCFGHRVFEVQLI